MGKLKITLKRSPINQYWKQKRTLTALGLKKMHQTVEKTDTPQIRGMIKKVDHMVQTEEV